VKGNRSRNTFEQWNVSVLQYPEQVPILARIINENDEIKMVY
jgi:hypothetical protein